MPALLVLSLLAADFASDVEPVLKKNCYACHTGKRPMAQLRLDLRAGLLKGGISGAAIVPGQAANSLLIHRVQGKGGQERMPPKADALKPSEIAALEAWINAGAIWPGQTESALDLEKHWAYKKPIKPAGTIDTFIGQRLAKEGLAFAPEASKETLIRRVTLDLTGLPPTPAEIDAFLNDNAPDAYQRVVKRLLASPHFGERQARPWLDLARYADTNGYEKDRRRTMFKFRDWVINAFNRDLPFDQFVIEQIAGDMLPNATIDQKIATGFHRNTMYNEEGGVDREEAHFEVLVDRVNTTGTVFLGSSLGCTQCHNHKYDPFTQKDYYSLMAFFNASTKEAEHYGDTSVKWKEPTLELATPAQETERKKLRARLADLQKKLDTQTPELDAEQAAWEAKLRDAEAAWRPLANAKVQAKGGTKLTPQGDAFLASGDNPQRETFLLEAPIEGRLTGLRLEALPHASLPRGGPGRDIYGNFILSALTIKIDGKPVKIARYAADNGNIDDKKTGYLWVVDASKEDTRLARQAVAVFAQPIEGKRIEVAIEQNSQFVGQAIGHFKVSVTSLADPALTARLRHNLRGKPSKALTDFHRNLAESLKPTRDEVKQLREELDKLNIVTALIFDEKAGFERPSDHIRIRGGFASKGDKVFANVPASLPPLPEDALPNRLGLARWIASRDNPLTARVAMNRLWEQYFGRGIVETSEDFGLQGARPEHPELLDYLATEFMDRNWSLKAMHELIVTSRAYKQSSAVSPALQAKDPLNKLISRGPRFRLEAEMVRDVTLAAAGLLSAKVGGPSVFPPQPPGVWDIPYSDDKWTESTGEDKFRRGLYTFVRRSAMYPSMMNFDATSREVCTVRRVRTNTPLQALTTMNDEAFFEAAQALGQRIQREGGSTDATRIDYGFRLTTGRLPKPTERDRLLSWLAQERAYFAKRPKEAGEWTMLGNVLLNLDETLTKE